MPVIGAAPLTDPIGYRPLEAVMAWAEGAALGPVAAIVSIIAVAGVGFLTLSGRVDLRRGATVIIGCFLVFGAGTIGGALSDGRGEVAPALPYVPPTDLGSMANASAPADYDPYAGASLRRVP